MPALVACLGYLGEARTRARWVVDARPIAELALVRMASLSEMEPLPQVVARLEALEALLAGAAPAAPPSDEKKKRPAPAIDRPAGGEAPDRRRKLQDAMNDPVVRKAVDIFEGRVCNVEPGPEGSG